MAGEDLGVYDPTTDEVNVEDLLHKYSVEDNNEEDPLRRYALKRTLNNKNTNYHNCVDLGLDDTHYPLAKNLTI